MKKQALGKLHTYLKSSLRVWIILTVLLSGFLGIRRPASADDGEIPTAEITPPPVVDGSGGKQYFAYLPYLSNPNVSYSPGKVYYVSTSGNDGYPGSMAQPFRTIQKCLNSVAAGDNCLIRGGTYNEALSLVTSGSSSAYITVSNYQEEPVTVNSGSSMTLKTTGYQSYYIINGLRLISSITGGEQVKTINFANGVTASMFGKTGGNSYITLRNCYVEGGVLFYGPNNTIDNCEFNGRNLLNDGIHFWFAASTNGTIRNSIIHDYVDRGIWADISTDGLLIQGNIIYNVKLGVDLDGAQSAVTHAKILDNEIFNFGSGTNRTAWGAGVYLEDALYATVDGNIIHDSVVGAAIALVNYGNGPDWYTTDGVEYRTMDTNTIISNNLIYGTTGTNSIVDHSASGVKFYNNTVVQSGSHYLFEFHVADGTSFVPKNFDFRNNIFVGTDGNSTFWAENTSTFTYTRFLYDLYYLRKSGPGETNYIIANPLFIGNGDYHLSVNSPAIDRGYNLSAYLTHDLDGTLRPQGSGFDIGAYEFEPE